MRRVIFIMILMTFFHSSLHPVSAAGPASGVEHIVICWLKNPGNEQERQRVIEASKKFKDIPGVVGVKAGAPLVSERETVDDSFDVAVVISFVSAQDLAAYEDHPEHLRAVEEVLIPLVERFIVYDVVNRNH